MNIDKFKYDIEMYHSILKGVEKELKKLYPSLKKVMAVEKQNGNIDGVYQYRIVYENSKYETEELFLTPGQAENFDNWIFVQLEEKVYANRYKQVINYIDELRGRIPKRFSKQREDEFINELSEFACFLDNCGY